MLTLFTISRKAQNFWHYTTMCNMLSFQDLTAKTQSRLIMENMQMCYSLTMSYYFFGHNANTAVEQEEHTGILTGLGDYIRRWCPYALGMPPALYSDYYRPPWATNSRFEERHRTLSANIGLSLKDIGIMGYILLYSLNLYDVTESQLREWKATEKDILTIKKVRKFIETIYVRL